ncbi:MAG: hypothetical protein NC122_03270 [Faecalibacterium sp.]|nr:hypothetical protein [Ruminococcus sp.]MCM1393176.1 hypothetical protein [Ruminococcus sp.]MCM1485207.1 hypothetical protein [Faecalibacterium sp.]
MINIETEKVIQKFFLKYEPWHMSVIANENDFIYINKNGDVICIDESNNFNPILKNPSDLTMRYLINFDYGKFAVVGCDYKKDIIGIYVCDMQEGRLCVSNYIECVGKFGFDCDNIGDNLFLSVSVSCGEGSKTKIIKINISNGTVEDFIESVSFAAHKNDILQKFSLSHDGNYIAITYNDSIVIVSLKTKNIVNRFNFEFPSDVQWLNDGRCLVSTWNGLFEIKI